MDYGRAVIPVIVSILILGAVDFSQEVNASHESGEFWFGVLEPYSMYPYNSNWCSPYESKEAISSQLKILIPKNNVGLDTHLPCTAFFKDSFLNEGVVYNFGTIIIDPQMSTATNRGTIINHGTMIINAIPPVETLQLTERDKEWNAHISTSSSLLGTMFLGQGEAYHNLPNEVKKFNNFFNEGTIINYGSIVIEGGGVSTGEIINKVNGKIEFKNFFYNEGKITNDYADVVSSVGNNPMYGGWPGQIVNTGSFSSLVPISNSGDVKNSGTFNGEVVNVCNGSSSGVTKTSILCSPSFWSPIGDVSNSPVEFGWNAATGYSENISKYRLLIVSKLTGNAVKSIETSNLNYKVSLDDGEYDIFVFPVKSDGDAILSTDSKRTITVKFYDLACPRDEEGKCIVMTITTIEVYTVKLTVATNGPLDLKDLVVFTDNGVQSEDRTNYLYRPEPDAYLSGGYNNGPHEILINPNGENGITWNQIQETITSEGKTYSVIFSGDCDGTNFLPVVTKDLDCTMTFNETTEPVEIPPPEAMESFVDLDYDGIGDGTDNCPNTFNPDQTDTNSDGIGDACESVEITDDTAEVSTAPIPPPTTSDLDSDAITDDTDNCPNTFNPDQTDTNSDGIGDACESELVCDDGTMPINGVCQAVESELVCDEGTMLIDGVCQAVESELVCDDGTMPIAGVCQAVESDDTIDDNVPIPPPTSPVPTPTTSESSKTLIEQFSIPKYKQVTQIPVSGEIQNYVRGNPVEMKIIKPDGTTESIGTMAKSSGEYFSQFEIDHTAQPGIYDVEVKYGGKVLESFSIKMISERVPEWIKNNAGWWAAGAIGEKDFVGGIQFLIKENIIDIPDLPEQASDVAEEKVPDWIKNNADWWAKGLISEDDFVNGIKFLVEKGIIVV